MKSIKITKSLYLSLSLNSLHFIILHLQLATCKISSHVQDDEDVRVPLENWRNGRSSSSFITLEAWRPRLRPPSSVNEEDKSSWKKIHDDKDSYKMMTMTNSNNNDSSSSPASASASAWARRGSRVKKSVSGARNTYQQPAKSIIGSINSKGRGRSAIAIAVSPRSPRNTTSTIPTTEQPRTSRRFNFTGRNRAIAFIDTNNINQEDAKDKDATADRAGAGARDDPSEAPREPEGVAEYDVCTLLYPCVAKDITHINVSISLELGFLNATERQEKQERGLCYKQPGEPKPGEPFSNIICYDDNPPATDFPQNPPTSTISRLTPTALNDGLPGAGFEIPIKNVFRYSRYFDLDNVADRYRDEDGELEFEYLDWPGPTFKAHTRARTEGQKATWSDERTCLQMLHFQGRANKYSDYICNDEEGLDTSVLALPTVGSGPDPDPDPGSGLDSGSGPSARMKKGRMLSTTRMCDPHLVSPYDEEHDPIMNLMCNLPHNRDKADSQCKDWPLPTGRIYLATGNVSMLTSYIQPMLIGEDVLRRLAHDPNDPKLPKLEPKLECSKMFSKDIRTVLDFAFASNRLILGMKCGVVIVKNIHSNDLEFDVAYLSSSDRVMTKEDQPSYHSFPYMINTVAASPCCTTNKMCKLLKPIVAIYSSYATWISYPTDYDHQALTHIYVSLDNGDTFDLRVMASRQSASNLIYWMYSKIPKFKQKDARPPGWVAKEWEKVKLGDDLSLDTIVVDPVTKVILQNESMARYNETDCDEIISMNAVSEENLLLVLCRDRDVLPPTSGNNNQPWSRNSYQIFSVPVSESIPLMVMQKRSKRKFSCEPIPDAFNPSRTLLPRLVRIPKSYSLFVVGCKNVIYSSSNGGKTLFAASFFYNDTEGANETHSNYVQSQKNRFLDQNPVLAIDPKGQTVMMTFGKYFAYGVITSGEMQFVSGPILENLAPSINDQETRPIYLPYYDDSGTVGVGVVYIQLLRDSKTPFFEENYAGRYAIRLLDCLLSIHAHALPYYTEYPDIQPGREAKTLKPCKTYLFKTNVTQISMDVGETATVHVSVLNSLKELPLNVLLTHDKAASLSVVSKIPTRVNDVILKAEPYTIPRQTAQIHAFFGSEYSNLEAVSSHLIISTEPQLRCHVQPREHVNVRFGCSKYMVAHEDERRPQCAMFRDNFQYSIPTGHFDETMASYWMRERPQFYKIKNGTLHVTYDYEMFGCPVQPYRLDNYTPDLRLLPLGATNSTEGEKFEGKFVLIEIFGASGYSFTKSFKDTDCIRAPPQTLEKMIEEWKVRVEAVRAAYSDYPYFENESIYRPINIWNRVNYKDCEGTQFVGEEDDEETSNADDDPDAPSKSELPGADDMELSLEEKRQKKLVQLEEKKEEAKSKYDGPYEIMDNRPPSEERNQLRFDPKIRQRVYIFLAVAVDPYDTFCNYHTYFGLSLAVPKEEDDVILIIIFFAVLFLLILLIVLGYYIRRYQVHKVYYKEAMYNRLLTAAWNLSFRYENLLSDSKITENVVKRQLVATKKLKFQKHGGILPPGNKKTLSGLKELRHRLRQ